MRNPYNILTQFAEWMHWRFLAEYCENPSAYMKCFSYLPGPIRRVVDRLYHEQWMREYRVLAQKWLEISASAKKLVECFRIVESSCGQIIKLGEKHVAPE